ncbi:hypothetical protein P152DRAFT_221491 [Eremomyces bilateralis CBS 781.70]|uniref:Fe2OG dioxygenase domain-containing protein n=1 Tax=Eremomyces bilateralis CBS 781.70 TaxID=1392243 RepID=A0A6G1FRL8_9PEZI|nr:uncharacterized protein P152DRAFT_221491 [Eremomyces bilateralis CBS 781.70]KAF1808423.1 hypothetical protein P152DRAFT_221491 [Eremomyces bilateralis CBS 781.70]
MPPKKSKVKSHDGSTGSAAQKQPKYPVDWPQLNSKRGYHDQNLSLHQLVPGQIITIPRFWDPALCKAYLQFLPTLPLITTPGKPRKGDAVRVNDRFQIDDAQFAEKLWLETPLRGLITGTGESSGNEMSPEQRRELFGGEVVGLNPNIRIYRYTKGQFFDCHYDDSNLVTIPGDPSIPARTTWTLLLYLTSCSGGETVFYPSSESTSKKNKSSKGEAPLQPVSIAPDAGLALLHRHGADCMLHEGREVSGGEKWVIRSDLCVRR